MTFNPTHRHKKRGTSYEVLGEAILHAKEYALHDGAQVIVYRGEDGQLWVRPKGQFLDGRFQVIKGDE
jgi:hypothetical protein